MGINSDSSVIIGDGFFSELIISVAAKQSGVNPANFCIFSQDEKRSQELREQYNVQTFSNPKELLSARVIVLAFYPDEAEEILSQIKNYVADGTLILSMLYGLTISKLEKIFLNCAIIRIAITPFIISGSGICAYLVGSTNRADAESIAQIIMSGMDKVIKVSSEQEFDLISKIFFAETFSAYHTINAMIEGAVNAGLSLETSREIAAQIFRGAARTIAEPDAVIESLLSRGQEEKHMEFVQEIGRKLVDRYNMWGMVKETTSEPAEKQKLLRFHYHW